MGDGLLVNLEFQPLCMHVYGNKQTLVVITALWMYYK